MSFPWLDRVAPASGGADRRAQVACSELSHRAALLYRLGFTAEAAIDRLRATIAWELDPISKHSDARHASLSDEAIAKIVHDTYARRPGAGH